MSTKKINPVRALDYLETILGKDWLEENLKVMKDSQFGKGGFGRSIDFNELGIAHVAKIWYKAREEMIDMEIVGGGLPGPYLLSASVLGNDIEILKDSTGLREKMDELKNVRYSLMTMHELGIASGYAQKGYHIDFINSKAADLPSIKGCSTPLHLGLFMTYGEGHTVIIMCGDIDGQDISGDTLAWVRHLQTAQLNQLAGRSIQTAGGGKLSYGKVLYLYVGDVLAGATSLLDKWTTYPEVVQLAHDLSIPVLVYTDGIIYNDNRPAYVRLGRLVQSSNIVSNVSMVKGIYVPNEQITAARL